MTGPSPGTLAKPSIPEINEAAARLREATHTRVPCRPVRELLGAASVDDAYAVQHLNTEIERGNGRRGAGWKIGLTSVAVQRQLGVDQPDCGILFADTSVGDDEPVDRGALLQPRVEAEVAFVLEHDLPDDQVTAVDVMRATAFVLPAIEIVDSRVAQWDITILDTVADNASSAMFVVGPKPTRLADVDLRAVQMTLWAGDRLVSEGSGADCLSHPVNAVVWLAKNQARLGHPLRAGDVVLSGALGPMVSVETGTRYEARIEGLGSVRTYFSEEA